MQTHDQYNGVFLSNDSQFAGHLSIARVDSLAKLVGKSFWARPKAEYADIHRLLSATRLLRKGLALVRQRSVSVALIARANSSPGSCPAGFRPLRGCGGGARWVPRNHGDPDDQSQSKAAAGDQTSLNISYDRIR